eukprot:2250875-Prymnesium_polylepis.1
MKWMPDSSSSVALFCSCCVGALLFSLRRGSRGGGAICMNRTKLKRKAKETPSVLWLCRCPAPPRLEDLAHEATIYNPLARSATSVYSCMVRQV